MRSSALACFFLLLTVRAALGQESGDPVRGHEYATGMCGECHGVDAGDMRRPDPDATPLQSVANDPQMSERALTVFFQTSHPTMPNLIVSGADARDLIAYILSLKPQAR